MLQDKIVNNININKYNNPSNYFRIKSTNNYTLVTTRFAVAVTVTTTHVILSIEDPPPESIKAIIPLI